MPVARQELERLLPLIADEVRLLSGTFPGGDGTGDLDLATKGLDFLWPLRLPEQWKICQFRNYDYHAWVWVLDRQGEVVTIDTLQDMNGIGRYGFPTSFATDYPGIEIRPWVRAAYLVLKRLRKGGLTPEEWDRFRNLAEEDWDGFQQILRGSTGPVVTKEIERALRGSRLPDAGLRRRVRRAVLFRRFRTPLRVAKGLFLGTRRWLERAVRPTGLVVVIAGPDGVGKSTLAHQLPESCRGLFLRHAHFHWRPGLLPGPGRILGREPGDPTEPHGRPPHSRFLSLFLLGYYWLDFSLGYWLRFWGRRARTGMVILERGWYDMAVDLRRYRLRVSPALVARLGALLPKPDLTLILEAPANILRARKRDLPEEELDSQMNSWRTLPLEEGSSLFLDVSADQYEVLSQARSAVVDHLEARTRARLGGGWVGLPMRRSPRWLLPRSPRKAASAGLRMYQPVTRRARLGWETARIAAALGAFKALPRGSSPPPKVVRALAPHLPPKATLSVLKSNHPGRYVAMIVDREGNCLSVAKVASDARGRVRLAAEGRALRETARHLPHPVVAPRVLHEEEGLLVMEAFSWRPRRHPWRLPEQVAWALGRLAALTASANGHPSAHGDCAPWNLLACDGLWVLVDWEDSRHNAVRFFDVFHYLVQSHALLGKPSGPSLIAGIAHQRGWVGSVISAYAGGAGVSSDDALPLFRTYLEATIGDLDPSSRDGQAGIEHRRLLLKPLK